MAEFTFTKDTVNDMLTDDVLALVAGDIKPSKASHETLTYLYEVVKVMVRAHDKNLVEEDPNRIVGKRGRKSEATSSKPTSIADILARR